MQHTLNLGHSDPVRRGFNYGHFDLISASSVLVFLVEQPHQYNNAEIVAFIFV